MSISLDQTQSSPGNSHVPAQSAPATYPRWLVLFFWGLVLLLFVAAIVMRLYHLALPFDRDSYDEGVYWQSMRSMLAGQKLYSEIFYSQPPLFLLSTYPGFALFGGTLWSARFGIVLVSLLGFPGAFLLGRTLAGRLGALAAMLLLLVDPLYLAQSQTIQAEASSVAFTVLSIAFLFLWWKQPDGWRGCCWAALCGLTFSLSVLCKLLCVSTIVPIVLLMLMRAWQIVRGEPGTSQRSWLPMLVGIVAALLAGIGGVVPFLSTFKDFWAGVVTFHTASSHVANTQTLTNRQLILSALLSVTTLAALYGAAVSLLRRDWRVVPILVWLLVTLAFLYKWKPLFVHHLIALEPPLITLALLGLAEPVAYKAALMRLKIQNKRVAPALSLGALVLILLAACFSFYQDIAYYQGADAYAAGPIIQQNVRVANDLRQAITPNEWVITDGQFIAGLADRSTPPWLVDTSTVRIESGYVTLADLEQAAMNPRVHAVLFYTGRFYYVGPVVGFHAWVATHFHLLHKYNNRGQELWVR